MDKRTRVRFAPSPTGPLHMGGVRTALYNYLYAKQNGGDFILRIEDTDSNRFVPGAEQYIIEALTWCGIVPDEGVDAEGHIVEAPSARHPHAPYRQSQRRALYRQYAEQLVASGWAYYAFDSAEDLAAKRAEAEARNKAYAVLKFHRKRVSELEAQLERDNARMDEIMALLADPDFYIREANTSDVVAEHAKLKRRIEDAETEWLRLTEEIEAEMAASAPAKPAKGKQ